MAAFLSWLSEGEHTAAFVFCLFLVCLTAYRIVAVVATRSEW